MSAGPLASLRRAVHPDDTLQVLPGGHRRSMDGSHGGGDPDPVRPGAQLQRMVDADDCQAWSSNIAGPAGGGAVAAAGPDRRDGGPGRPQPRPLRSSSCRARPRPRASPPAAPPPSTPATSSTGDIFRGNLQRGTAERFIDAPAGRMAVGMAADLRHGLLFVAGGFTGQAYIYDLRTGATVASYQLTAPATSLVNDVAVTKDRAWFTDSFQPRLYFVPVNGAGVPAPTFRTLELSGPAAAISPISGAVNLNGIQATANGKTLIVAHAANAQLDTVDPTTGASATIAGVSVPNVDGIVLEAGRLWAVQNLSSQVSRIRLAPDLPRGWWRR